MAWYPFDLSLWSDVKHKRICIITTGRLQSKTLLTIDERGSKIARNSVFDCHLSPSGAINGNKNSVSNDFSSMFVDSIDVFNCHLPGVILYHNRTDMPNHECPLKVGKGLGSRRGKIGPVKSYFRNVGL